MAQRRPGTIYLQLRACGIAIAGAESGFGHATVKSLRFLTTRAGPENEILREFGRGNVTPRIVPFHSTPVEAQAAFDRWHKGNLLSPSDLLSGATAPMKQTLLPFWLFDSTLQVHYKGWVGQKRGQEVVDWKESEWRDRGRQDYSWTTPSMQIYASYGHRRDLVEAVKAVDMLSHSRPLQLHEAESKTAAVGRDGGGIPLEPPEMRQAIAWEFALMAIKKQEAALAEALLRMHPGTEVKDVQIKVRTLRRRARLLYVPAFTVSYHFGEHFNVHGVRRPETFQAVIGAMPGSSVAAERHYSPAKVQVAAAAGMGVLSSLAAAIGLQGQSVFSPASVLAMLLVCTSMGLTARLSPLLLRQQEEDQRIQVEDSDMEQIMSQSMGPSDVMDDRLEDIRTASEWRRWEEANKWDWQGVKRRRWAESLWRRQKQRRIEMQTFLAAKRRAEARFRYEQQQEAKRRERWGEQPPQNPFSGNESGGGRKDFLGYYALLGLDGDDSSGLSQPDIKRAFHEAALRWHPDRLQVADEEARTKAHEQFSKVQRAYDVLKVPKTRREYDSGLNVSDTA